MVNFLFLKYMSMILFLAALTLILVKNLQTLQEKEVLPPAYSFAVSFLSGLTAKAHMPSAMGKADGKALADGVELICRQPFLSRQLTDGKQRNS